MSKSNRPPITWLTCDTCGQRKTEWEFVETIEEYLCESCASGLDEDDDEFHDDGIEF